MHRSDYFSYKLLKTKTQEKKRFPIPDLSALVCILGQISGTQFWYIYLMPPYFSDNMLQMTHIFYVQKKKKKKNPLLKQQQMLNGKIHLQKRLLAKKSPSASLPSTYLNPI